VTAEEKVKKVYPDAQWIGIPGRYRIRRLTDGLWGEYLSDSKIHKSWAWADALRRIKAQSKEK
jgi:hypothetical protein